MNIRTTLLYAGVIATSVTSLVFAGCSKKETKAEPTAATSVPQTQQDALKKKTEQLAATAEKTATAVTERVAAGAATAQKEAQAAAASLSRAVGEVTQKTVTAAESAQKTAQSALAGAAAAVPQAPPVQLQAAELLSRYTEVLEVLTKNGRAIKMIIDQNANLLPAGVQAKYAEFNAMLPALTSLVASLKDYQKVDLTTVVPKLQEDFAKAQKLYGEIRGLLPTSLSAPPT